VETLEALGHQIQSVEDLGSVVKIMKSLAAVNIQQYEEAVHALRDYNRSLELGMQILIRRNPGMLAASSADPAGRLAAVVIGSDQGMCGQFNSRIVAYAAERLDAASRTQWHSVPHSGEQSPSHGAGETQRHSVPQPPLILAVGVRVAAELDASPFPVTESVALPGSVGEITRRVQELLLTVNRWREETEVRRVWLFHQRPLSGASYEPHFEQVIPLGDEWFDGLRARPWPTRMLPAFTMDWRDLFSSLVGQHLFGALYRALAESLAAENAARLASMQAAEKNIDERLDDLTKRYHQQRQNAITEELLDVTAGFEVLGGQGA
jgi:F-type H+-transporting ATPase subunit gamma